MCVIDLTGARTREFLQFLLANDVGKLKRTGKALYSCMLNETGGVIDDLIVYFFSDRDFRLVVNAGTRDKDLHWIRRHAQDFAIEVRERTDLAMLAVQGPEARQKSASLLSAADRERALDLPAFVGAHVADWFIARTGYTGEDGFEIYFGPEQSERVWNEILDAGQEFGIKPCGLGARNTLRLEAGMALYGHEIHATITPFEAGLAWIVKLDKGDFIGRAALVRQKEQGVTRKLIGFEMTGRGIGRDDYEVFLDRTPGGWVSSGGPSPTLNRNIGMCYLPAGHSKPDQRIQIAIRNQLVEAITISAPFYKRIK
jgi:aminomethyltransferase